MPAGLLPLQADTAAFRRLPAPAPPVAGLSSLAPWAPRGLCSRLCRDAHSRRLNPADPHHCCFSTRDATSLLVLQSNFRGRGFPRLCTARESGGTWLLGCSPGFPPWVETSGQERGSGRQRQASSASSPEHSTQFLGVKPAGVIEGGEGHAAAAQRWTDWTCCDLQPSDLRQVHGHPGPTPVEKPQHTRRCGQKSSSSHKFKITLKKTKQHTQLGFKNQPDTHCEDSPHLPCGRDHRA